jgi:hypothetical protein
VRNRRKNKISTSSSVKTNSKYHCRKTLHSRRKPNDNLRGPFGDVSRTRLADYRNKCNSSFQEELKIWRLKCSVQFQHVRLNTHTYNSVNWIVYVKYKLRRQFVCFYGYVKCKCFWVRLRIIRPISVKDAALMLTVDGWSRTSVDSSRCRRRSFHCWQPMLKTYLLLLAVDVEDAVFVVDSRCRRPTFRC